MNKNGSEYYTGVALSPGVAVGKAYIYRDLLQYDHEYYSIEDDGVDDELERVDRAVREVSLDLEALSENVTAELNKDLAKIFKAQKAILLDPAVREEVQAEISRELVNSEQVIKTVFRRLERKLKSSGNAIISERGGDVADVAKRLIKSLKGIRSHSLEGIPEGVVLCAKTLHPSDTVHLPRNKISGVAVEKGGVTSHTAIITRELGIPAISGIDRLLDKVESGQQLIVDCDDSVLILSPEEEAVRDAEDKRERMRHHYSEAKLKADKPAVTVGGETVEVFANVSGEADVGIAMENGAEGIGLFRLEMFYMRNKSMPSHEELYGMLDKCFRPVGDMPITVRLLDIGADKELPYLDLPVERDPMLGRRGVRLLMDYPELVKAQVKALLRLSDKFNIRILLPLVTLGREISAIREVVVAEAKDCGIERIPPLGAMIETPAAALCADGILEIADFLSIGSNDLTQYTMVAGRENNLVSEYYDSMNPAVWKLIKTVADSAGDKGKPLEVCGEMATDDRAVRRLVAAGIRMLSVTPLSIPLVKELVRNCP